jgi:hypothetical protein
VASVNSGRGIAGIILKSSDAEFARYPFDRMARHKQACGVMATQGVSPMK